jgi:hypothetical protein
MTTRSEIRAIIRRDKLKDTTATTYKFSDETINESINDAIRDYSNYFSRQLRTVLAHVDNQTEYTLPSDFREAQTITDTNAYKYNKLSNSDRERRAFYDTTYPTYYTEIPYYTTASIQEKFYSIWGDKLYITPAADIDLILYYNAYHPVLRDDITHITIAQDDEDLIIIYAWATCLSRDAGQDALLQRWDEGSGRRDDNPVLMQYTRLFKEYKQKIEDRLARREAGGY